MGVTVREKSKGSGVYWLFINHHGQRKSKKIGRDKSKALEAAKQIEAKLNLGMMNLLEEKTKTFKEYSDTWIQINVPATCKQSTADGYKGLLDNHILSVFGDMPINEIKKSKIKEFLMKKYKSGVSASRVGQMKSVMSGVFNMAEDDETLLANPAHRLGKIYRVKPLQDEINPLDRDELSLLLSSFKDNYPEHYPFALTLARTGMRLGEAMALKWGDVDFNGRFIRIERALTKDGVDTPKSGKSRRVDMSKQLTMTLKQLKTDRKLVTLKNGWKSLPEYVFINREGQMLDKNNWRNRVFNKALEKAKLRKVRIHDIRHTYASLLIQANESLAYIRDQLGHHSIKVTVDIYGHLAPEGNKAAVDALDDLPIQEGELGCK
ncbi:site-specific integrase [Desulfobacterales bacterium HSG17]|nr:site-specific integrase [Desulfobacterales bacterium HSG17]